MFAPRDHGAVEKGEEGRPLMVMIAGPIKVWWQRELWESGAHISYTAWRNAVEAALAEAGHLVYSPYRAWRGPWNEAAQAVNDAAIATVDVVLDLTPPGVTAEGTAREVALARRYGVTVLQAPPGSWLDLQALLETLASCKAATCRS